MNTPALFKFIEYYNGSIYYYVTLKSYDGHLFNLQIEHDVYYSDASSHIKEIDIQDESFIISYYERDNKIYPCIHEDDDSNIILLNNNDIKIVSKSAFKRLFIKENINLLNEL